jgi:hypothetical protein
MWAAFTCAIFLLMQYLYFLDWHEINGDDPAWHRAMVFVPYILFVGIFIQWGVGVSSMLAHAVNLEFLAADVGDLSHTERASFLLSTTIGIICIPLLYSLAYAHRNSLGQFYYLESDDETKEVEVVDYPIPVQGSFQMRGMVAGLVERLGIFTTATAQHRMPGIQRFAVALQLPFYVFVIMAYGGGAQSSLPIIFICLGFVALLVSLVFFNQSLSHPHGVSLTLTHPHSPSLTLTHPHSPSLTLTHPHSLPLTTVSITLLP